MYNPSQISSQYFNLAAEAFAAEDYDSAILRYDACLCSRPNPILAFAAFYNLDYAISSKFDFFNREGSDISDYECVWSLRGQHCLTKAIEIYEQNQDYFQGNDAENLAQIYADALENLDSGTDYGIDKLGDNGELQPRDFDEVMRIADSSTVPPLRCLEEEIEFNEVNEDEVISVDFVGTNEFDDYSEDDAELVDLAEPLNFPHIDNKPNGEMMRNTLKTQQVNEIVGQINNLLFSYETNAADSQQAKDKALNNAEEKFHKLSREIQNISNENDGIASKIRSLLQGYESSATRHLKTQNVSTAVEMPFLPAETGNQNQLDLAQQSTDRANKLYATLSTQKMPQNLGTVFGVMVVAGLVIGACGGIANKSETFFFISLIGFTIFGGLIALLMSSSASSSMQKLYADILINKQIGETAIEKHLNVLKGNNQANLANERKIWENKIAEINRDYQRDITKIIDDAKNNSQKTQVVCGESWEAAGFAGLTWAQENWKKWQPFERDFNDSNFSATLGKLQSQSNVNLSFNVSFEVPALMSLNSGRGLLFKVPSHLKNQAVNMVQSLMLRFLATMPPATVQFTMFDPVGLGQNVAAFIPLGKFSDKLITSRAWSEPKHIEEELEKLTLHLQDVIQMRLRNEHKNIEEYNRKSKVPEPYRVLTVMDFPTNCREDAVRRLVSIAENGARCGVYPIVVVDTDLLAKNAPYNFNLQNLAQHLDIIQYENGNFVWTNRDDLRRWKIEPDILSLEHQKDLINEIINRVGEKSVKAMTVEVPFDELLGAEKPTLEKLWLAENSTAKSLKIPLGPQNVEDNQYLTFGESGTAHHAIIIGRTGSGKTNLMDVIITAAALEYSPEEIEFYLIDMKGGLGFKHYVDTNLPHARVIAIESEREFALSVLRGLIDEIGVRTKIFNSETAENIQKYRNARPEEKIPRILLVVDEFQNLFLEDDQISRESSAILERLTREGRAYGIHVILGSQSLAGKASNLSGATLGQIGIRIALMCSESDARAIMADDNPEARLLSRPGEAIFNDRNGLIEGNKRFQVARFKDEVRQKYLGMIGRKAQADNLRKPIIFEGNKLARLEESEPLKKLVRGEWKKDAKRMEAWLGDPIKLSEKPVAVRFRRQAGNNLLIVSKEENEGVGMLAAAWLSLALQHEPKLADFYTFNLTNSEEPWFELLGEIGEMLPHNVEKLNRHNLVEKLQKIMAEITVRMNESRGDGKTKYLLVFGLQRAKDLRPEDGGGRFGFSSQEKEPDASELFAKILREGAECGVHVLTWCDLVTNVKRTLDHKSMNEFNSRVASMMSQDDSQFILDNAAASRLDRPHRAIFYDEDRPGYLEKFRPFAIPTNKDWWLEMTKHLNALHSKAQSN